jgi:hypothetical protein
MTKNTLLTFHRLMGTAEGRRDIEIDYPLAFCHAFAPSVARQQKPFKYVHCSGRLAEKDQNKCLLFLQDGRRIKVNPLTYIQNSFR